jgi:hypothetical protein
MQLSLDIVSPSSYFRKRARSTIDPSNVTKNSRDSGRIESSGLDFIPGGGSFSKLSDLNKLSNSMI